MDSVIPRYQVKELPSRFIGYPDDVVIYAKPHCFGSALNIEMVGKNNLKTMEEIMEGIDVEGMPKNMLTPQDILFLGIYRNLLSSKHDKIDLKSFCPKCLHENHHVESLKTIKFKPIEAFDKSVYPLKVEFSECTMWFTFLNYKDFEFCMKTYNGAKLAQLALQVKKYQFLDSDEVFEKPQFSTNTRKENDLKKIKSWVDTVRNILYNLVDEDMDVLEEVIRILEDYGLKKIEVECQDPKCKNKYEVDLDGEGVLVKPFRDTTKSSRDRIILRKDDIDKPDRAEEDEPERSGTPSRINDERKTKRAKHNVDQQITYFDK